MIHEIPDLALVGTLYQWLDGQINNVGGDVHHLDTVETVVLRMLRTTLRGMSAQADEWVEERLTVQSVAWPAPAQQQNILGAGDLFIMGAAKPDWAGELGKGYHDGRN